MQISTATARAATLLLGALSLLPSSHAQGPPKGFSGSLVRVDGDQVVLKDKDGKEFTVMMTPGWTVSVNRKADASAIAPGSFIATTNVAVDKDSGKATELRVLEPGYRPEFGTHAVSDTNPNMMTHGTVKSAYRTADGVQLEVVYPGGSRHIMVPADAPVVVSDPLGRDALRPGVAVSGVTRPGTDGVPHASRVQLPTP